ncbi:MAG: nicotinamide-nucleotide amidohydrolase family protein [Verrucomicrobia bacterium]|nr:nicotinamide-nucleotide amidohydrolase family protein [Verrucomicrobiota bacterium]MDE3098378.1 CinA family protein [Verrucomicrobiota bacterium]
MKWTGQGWRAVTPCGWILERCMTGIFRENFIFARRTTPKVTLTGASMPRYTNRAVTTDNPEVAIVRLLARRKLTLATAESCTGGFIAHRITNVPGASKVLYGGIVAYGNRAKIKFLGVRARTLERHGAVSAPTAREMAEGARKKFATDFAIAVTGIAGPGGGTKAKPVGTVFVALAGGKKTQVEKKFNPFGRLLFKRAAASQALKLLMTALQNSRRPSSTLRLPRP